MPRKDWKSFYNSSLNKNLCVYCNKRDKENTSVFCEICRLAKNKRGNDKINNGLCRHCLKPQLPNHTFCQEHLLLRNKNSSDLRKKAKDSGICFYCKDKQVPERLGKTVCSKCQISEYKKKVCRKLGIDLSVFETLEVQQKGLCKICGEPPKTGKILFADHCHTTNKLRGLLCDNCNFLLGHAKDDVEILQMAINYLKESNGSSNQI